MTFSWIKCCYSLFVRFTFAFASVQLSPLATTVANTMEATNQVVPDSDSTYGSDEMYLFDDDDLLIDSSTDSSGSYSAYVECKDISIGGDATYCIEGFMCSGDGEKPTGYDCPLKNDVAVAECLDNMRSFLNGECVAPRDSVCHKASTGSWGCVWEDEVVVNRGETGTTTTNGGDTTNSGTETTTDKDDCTEVSVEGDATYCIPGVICSGEDAKPAGDLCPVSGDVAVSGCHDYVPSYLNGKCVAPSDGVCQKIKTGAWGCVWGNGDGTAASYVVDTTDGGSTVSTGGSSAAVVGVVVAVVIAAVIVGVAIAWSRHKRQNRNNRYSDVRMDAVLTPPGSSLNGAAFNRV